MIKLAHLLNEVLVKNKKTGNVYDVEKFNPAAHEKAKPADIKKVTAKTGKPAAAGKNTKVASSTKSYNPAQAFNKKVSKMTNDNQHSAAAVELAMYMNDREAVSKLQQIKKYLDNRGHLRPSEAKERGELVAKLLQRAKRELSDKDYKLINSSF